MQPRTDPWVLPARFQRLFWLLVGVGVIATAFGLAFQPERVWTNWLIGQSWMLGIVLGAVFFIAIHYVANAGWHTVIRRVPEALASALPLVGLLTVPLLIPAVLADLYPWAAPAAADAGAHAAHGAHAGPAMSPSKAFWLSPGFFIIRIVLYFGIWWLLTRGVLAASRRQDAGADVAHTRRGVRFSAGFLAAGAVTICLASFDLLMSLTPHWFSTMFGVYYFSGSFLSALCVMALLVIGLRRWAVLPQVRDDHLHNLGKLVFAFSTFWAYIWFSQFMLIWYSNLPEETSYFITRHENGWNYLFLLNLAMNWIIPFLVLLPRAAKRNERILGWVCVLILAGQWLDHYLMVMPDKSPQAPVFGLLEVGMIIGFAGALMLVVFRAFGHHRPVPVNDPYLAESMALHT